MKTRFSSLVKLKKDAMQKSEQELQRMNNDLKSAKLALEDSYTQLSTIQQPTNGSMGELLASRMILDTQRHNIAHNKEWINFAQKQSNYAKKVLKKNMIEYEKFKYLELEEIKKALKAQKIQESKELDEIALLTHSRKHK